MHLVGEWKPDLGPFQEDGTDYVMNVQPTGNGWGPFPNLVAISNALGAACFGACYFRSSTGSYGYIAATQTAFKRLNTGTSPYSWTDITGASVPAIPDGQLVQFERFGGGLYACSLGVPLQLYDVDAGGVFADAPGSPPRSKYITTVGDFLVLGYLKVGATEYPSKWMNSSLNLLGSTPWTVGSNLADEQVIPDGDEIMGLLGGVDGGLVFQRRAIRSLLLDANPAMPIRMHAIDVKYGVVAPYSVVPVGSGDFAYLAEDGFKRGVNRDPIGTEKVNRYFFDHVDLSQLETVQGAADPFNHMVWWRYFDGSVYKMIGWDWELNRWTQADANARVLASAVIPGYTLEALTALFTSLYGAGSVDVAGAASFDSRIWKGGRPVFGAIGTDGIFYFFAGSPAAATLDTQSKALAGNIMRRSKTYGAQVAIDTPSATLQLATTDRVGDALTYRTAVSQGRTGLYPVRGAGRLGRFRINVPAGTSWNVCHGVEVEPKSGGKQ